MQIYRLPRRELLGYFGVPGLITLSLLIWLIPMFDLDRGLPDNLFTLAFMGVFVWSWYTVLAPVFEITVVSRDKVVFRSAFRRITLGPRDITSIAGDPNPRRASVTAGGRRITVRHARGSLKLLSRVAGLEQFLEWIRSQNEAVTLTNMQPWTRSDVEPLFSISARTYRVTKGRWSRLGFEALAIPFFLLIAIWEIRDRNPLAALLAVLVILEVAPRTWPFPTDYTVSVRTDGAIEFRSLFRKTVLWPREIVAVAADPANESLAEVRHQHGSVRMMRSIDDFPEFLARVKGLNRNVTVWGL